MSVLHTSAAPLISLLLTGLAAAQATTSPAAPPTFTEIPGVREFRGVLTARPSGPAARADLAQVQVVRHIPEVDEYLIQVPAGESEQALADALFATGHFEYVEPDWLCYPVNCPNDPQFNSQWHHQANRMQSCDAWSIETGDPSIVVAICDSGVRPGHEDLQLHRQEGYHVPSETWESAGGPVNDINGHGTLCAGTAAANGDNGLGVAGVGWNLGYRPVRVTDNSNGTASLSNLTKGARAAADAGDRVASVSFSGGTSSTVRSTGDYIRARNALLVWAAGNDSVFLVGNREDSVILVGATHSGDSRSGFSNYGPLVDLVAPGSSIRTTSNGGNSAYGSVSGTSFACPMTAGLCALIWSRNPLLAPHEVEQILRASCEDLGPLGLDNDYGYGRINSFRALSMTPPPTVQVNYSEGRPSLLDPAGGLVMPFEVVAGQLTPVSGAAQFWVDTGSGFTQGIVSHLGNDQYEATFPATACPAIVAFYIEVPTLSGASETSPVGAPGVTFTADALIAVTVLEDELETAGSWVVGAAGDTASAGLWEHVGPIGTVAQPYSDHTVNGSRCFLTGQHVFGSSPGVADVDGGSTTLMSPRMDLSFLSDPQLSYWRSFSNNQGNSPSSDILTIDVSPDDGVSWVNVEVVGPQGPDTSVGWRQFSFDVNSLIPLTDQVRLRFVASDLGADSLVEAAIDDLRVIEPCAACGTQFFCPAAMNSAGSVASIGFSGTPSFHANDLTLTAFGCPPGENGLFLYSPDAISTPLGNGTLCVGSSTLGFVIRLGVVTIDAFGAASYPFDNTNPPIPPGQIATGETWHFQFWYRDTQGGGALFNLSNGLTIEFCP